MIGARLLEHLVEEIGASGRFSRVLVLSGGDKVRVGGVAFCLRLLLAFLLGAALSGRLGDIFRLAALGLLSARRTAASSRRFLSSPWIRRPSVVDGSGIARRSIAVAARFWPTPLEAGGGLALTSSAMRCWMPWGR
jgi:hypothetical protein